MLWTVALLLLNVNIKSILNRSPRFTERVDRAWVSHMFTLRVLSLFLMSVWISDQECSIWRHNPRPDPLPPELCHRTWIVLHDRVSSKYANEAWFEFILYNCFSVLCSNIETPYQNSTVSFSVNTNQCDRQHWSWYGVSGHVLLLYKLEVAEDQKYVNIYHSPEAIRAINYKKESDYKGKLAAGIMPRKQRKPAHAEEN